MKLVEVWQDGLLIGVFYEDDAVSMEEDEVTEEE
jgi:hypothetical protein